MKQSLRQQAWTNIIAQVLNEGLDRGLISPTTPSDDARADDIVLDLQIAGVPASASIADRGHGELRIGVVIGAQGDEGRRWASVGLITNHGAKLRRQIGACALAEAWVERKNGFHLQTHIGGERMPTRLCCAAEFLPVAANMNVEPQGFQRTGKFYM
jgi:hypothetical protein